MASASQVYNALKASGLSPVEAAAFVMISERESGFRETAANENGERSYGLFQINLDAWDAFLRSPPLKWSDPKSKLQTFDGAIAAVTAIYRNSGMNPWGGYKEKSWNHLTNVDTGVAASGGEVTAADISGFGGYDSGQGRSGPAGTGTASTNGTGGKAVATGDDAVREQYGYMAWALDDPELGPLLRKAASEGWSAQRLDAELHQTKWFQKQTENQRGWATLVEQDPATAEQKRSDMAAGLRRQAGILGVPLSDERLVKITEDALSRGWGADDIQRALLAEFRYTPKRDETGGFAEQQVDVRKIGAQFGMGVSDKAAFTFSKKLLGGEMTEDDVRSYYRRQAQGLYPQYADELERGLTVEELYEPYRNVAAQLLERDPDSIDLTAPVWHRPLSKRGKDGKPTTMSLLDWRETLMTDDRYGWDRTQNARDEAVAMVTGLGRTMGVV